MTSPFFRRFCRDCGREFAPASPDIHYCSICGGPPEAQPYSEPRDVLRVRTGDCSIDELLITPDGKHAVLRCLSEWPESPFEMHGCAVNLELWDLERFEYVRSYNNPQRQGFNCMSISPDGCFVLAGRNRDHEIYLWRIDDGMQEGRVFKPPGRNIHSAYNLCVSPDGRYAVSGGGAKIAYVWELSSGLCLQTLEENNAITGLVILPDGNQIITASYPGTLHLWEWREAVCLITLHTELRIRIFSLPRRRISSLPPQMARFMSGNHNSLFRIPTPR